MGTIILSLLGLLIFWILFDKLSAKKELTSDGTLTVGLINRYPHLFEFLLNENFKIEKETKTEVKLSKLLSTSNRYYFLEIIYQSDNRLQFIIQCHILSSNSFFKSKHFYCNRNSSQESIIQSVEHTFFSFVGETIDHNSLKDVIIDDSTSMGPLKNSGIYFHIRDDYDPKVIALLFRNHYVVYLEGTVLSLTTDEKTVVDCLKLLSSYDFKDHEIIQGLWGYLYCKYYKVAYPLLQDQFHFEIDKSKYFNGSSTDYREDVVKYQFEVNREDVVNYEFDIKVTNNATLEATITFDNSEYAEWENEKIAYVLTNGLFDFVSF